MGVKLIQESTLTNIANAIREKKGTTDALDPANFATEISSIASGGEIPSEYLTYRGVDCSYMFMNGTWDWVIEHYGSKISIESAKGFVGMFKNSKLVDIPININIAKDDYQYHLKEMFSGCENLKTLPHISFSYDADGTISMNGGRLFGGCKSLVTIPDDFIDFKHVTINSNSTSDDYSAMFVGCYNLRSVSTELLKRLNCISTSSSYSPYNQMFSYCYKLDEAIGVPVVTATYTSNRFDMTFSQCFRISRIVFDTDNGVAKTAKWTKQTIDLSNYIGYGASNSFINEQFSGVPKVTDDTSYQTLKDNPDWWTQQIPYSRYNHDSAVGTINSLPDTSAYLATAGGTNTIKFRGASGSSTDGGAINTLTEEEIAVATAKGWTVTFV